MGSSWMLLFCCFLLSVFAVACCSLWHAGAGACFLCLPCGGNCVFSCLVATGIRWRNPKMRIRRSQDLQTTKHQVERGCEHGLLHERNC